MSVDPPVAKIQSDDGWETMSETEEWEEQLVYVELDDVPSVQELFAVQPDYFLRFQRKRYRKKTQTVKATHPKVTLKFHQFDSSAPALQIGNRYFACKWEEPTGTGMMFRKKGDAVSVKQEAKSSKKSLDSSQRSCSTLRNIVPEPFIPRDTIFGGDHLITKNTYECVALADKVLKTELLDADKKRLNRIPTNRQFFGRPGSFKIPQGYTATELLAGEYIPSRTYSRKRKQHVIIGETAEPLVEKSNSGLQVESKKQETSKSDTDVEMM